MDNGYQALARALDEKGLVWRVTSLEGETLGQAVQLEQRPAWLGHGFQPPWGRAVLVECLRREKTLLICGGGHVSVPVARLGVMLGYQVTVVDDREEFAQPQRFEPGVDTVCAPFEEYLSHTFPWEEHPDLSVVIVTRGHGGDTACLRQAVKHPLTYLGMIGSKRKNQAIFQLLQEEGVAPQALERVHAPIGLDIGAQTGAPGGAAVRGWGRHGHGGEKIRLCPSGCGNPDVDLSRRHHRGNHWRRSGGIPGGVPGAGFVGPPSPHVGLL